MPAHECISGTVTGVGATLTAWTMNGNDRNVLRTGPGRMWLLNAWSDTVVPGVLQITSGKLHDSVDAIRVNPSGAGETCLPLNCKQELRSGDVLTIQQSGSAGVGDIDSGTIAVYYENLPGLDQNLINQSEFKRRFKGLKTVPVAHTPSVIGGYGGLVALTNMINDLKGNTEYAILGFDTNNLVIGTVTVQGPDTKGLRIPIPYSMGDPDYYHQWFLMLAQTYPELDIIPVLNSENKAATFIESVHSSVFAPAGNITLILAELS